MFCLRRILTLSKRHVIYAYCTACCMVHSAPARASGSPISAWRLLRHHATCHSRAIKQLNACKCVFVRMLNKCVHGGGGRIHKSPISKRTNNALEPHEHPMSTTHQSVCPVCSDCAFAVSDRIGGAFMLRRAICNASALCLVCIYALLRHRKSQRKTSSEHIAQASTTHTEY